VIGSLFYGSLLGVFLLAFLVKRANARGAFYGLIGGMVAVGMVSAFTEISWLWYNVIGSAVVVLIGLLLSVGPAPVTQTSSSP
jgi:Na+/proline symporter